MALNLTLRDARLEVMRGNMDKEAVQRKAPPKPALAAVQAAPEPTPQPTINVDLAPVADAMRESQKTMAQMIANLPQPENKAAVTKWSFKITERDRMGNIISFEAIAQ